jgi:hypothetical protein
VRSLERIQSRVICGAVVSPWQGFFIGIKDVFDRDGDGTYQ